MSAPHRDLRILYIEDEALPAARLQRELLELGYPRIRHFKEWDPANVALREEEFDIALLDIQLKGSRLDGIAIAGVIASRYGLPLVFLTSFQDDETLARLSAHPTSEYVTKPFEAGQVDAALRKAFAKTSLPATQSLNRSTGSHRSYLADQRAEANYLKANGPYRERRDYAEVLYIESRRKQTYVFLKNGRHKVVNTNFTDTLASFRRDDLVRIHRSFAVPYHNVCKVYRDCVYLFGHEDALPVGGHYRDLVRELFTGPS